MTTNTILSEEEAKEFLLSLEEVPEKTIITALTPELTQEENDTIIRECNKLLLERITLKDGTIRASELIWAKDTAFKHNQLLKGQATENIQINLKELPNKTPEELLELYDSIS